MDYNYTLDVAENDLTTSISIHPGVIQVTTAEKLEGAMVYVWGSVSKKLAEYRFDTHDEARAKAWEVAIAIGRNGGNFDKENN